MSFRFLHRPAVATSSRVCFHHHPHHRFHLLASTRSRTSSLPSNTLRFRPMSTTQYEYILTSRPAERVALITLNRPKALNALCSPLFQELNEALRQFDEDDQVGVMVITGSERAFAGTSCSYSCLLVFFEAMSLMSTNRNVSWSRYQRDEGKDLYVRFLIDKIRARAFWTALVYFWRRVV